MAMDRIDPPSLDWKAFESRLAQLQQNEAKKETEIVNQYYPGYNTGPWNRDALDEVGEDHEMTKRITALTSGIHTHQSMQLCFINDSSSDLESDGEDGPTLAHRGHERESSRPDEQVRCLQQSEAMKCWLETEDLKRMSLDQLQRLSEGISHDIQRLNLELLQALTEREDLQIGRDGLLFHLQELTQREDLDMNCTNTLFHLQESTRSAGHSDKELASRGGHTVSLQTSQSKGC
ncbi:uncharacterized protein LOC144799631 isoform X2 [Lissotriton helveticus]